jgi:hypothetical protein
MRSECITLSTRGIWHKLLEAFTGERIIIENPLKMKIKYLFALCPNIGVEYEKTYMKPNNLISLIEPKVMINSKNRELWVRFSIDKWTLSERHLSSRALTDLISGNRGYFKRIKGDDDDLLAFESRETRKYLAQEKYIQFELRPEVKFLNLFASLGFDGMDYSIPIQSSLPMKLPQIVVKYSIIFWLASLVRYDPHSVEALQESRYWILIDGFMNQSRIWLLNLFEWQILQQETCLRKSQ